jgi:hypothetical protein
MVREKIKVEEFDRISKEHEYFLWNFVLRDIDFKITMGSIFDNIYDGVKNYNHMDEFLSMVDVPYFESYIEESIDFLDLIGVPLEHLRQKGEIKTIKPFMLSFNRKRFVNATYNGFCFCAKGIAELVYDLNPDFIHNAKID